MEEKQQRAVEAASVEATKVGVTGNVVGTPHQGDSQRNSPSSLISAASETCPLQPERRGVSPETRRKFEEARRHKPSRIRAHIQEAREAERLTREDFQVRINTQR